MPGYVCSSSAIDKITVWTCSSYCLLDCVGPPSVGSERPVFFFSCASSDFVGCREYVIVGEYCLHMPTWGVFGGRKGPQGKMR